jgi:drug/metabolite transporter (DMT)-like permease
VAYLLAIASAALYGAADFLGGLASRRASTIAVVASAQAAGLLVLLLVLPLLPDASPSRSDLGWGAMAGLAGSVGVGLLYRALAIGTMAVVAPTTAVCAVVIPVMAGVLGGDRLAPMTMSGIGLAVLAIVLVSRETSRMPPGSARLPGTVMSRLFSLPRGVGIAFASGVAIGLFFLALARTSPAAGMWPLVASRVISLILFAVIGVVTGQPLLVSRPVARVAIGAGVIDIVANAFYLVATRYGTLSVVVTLASLYPASTVILARVVLRERLNNWQVVGVVCALGAIVLIVSGDAVASQ